MRTIVRRTFAQLAAAAALVLAIALGSAPAPPAAALTRAARIPSAAVHTEFIVEVNRKGQVSRVRSGKSSRDPAFNTMTYGNALQAFIRRPDGDAVPGTYRLSYDFNPKTQRVKRAVSLVRAGGVDPGALGAVDAMAALEKRGSHKVHAPASPLPDFQSITGHR